MAYAAASGKDDIVKIILEQEGNKLPEDVIKDAYHQAEIRGHSGVMELFSQFKENQNNEIASQPEIAISYDGESVELTGKIFIHDENQSVN